MLPGLLRYAPSVSVPLSLGSPRTPRGVLRARSKATPLPPDGPRPPRARSHLPTGSLTHSLAHSLTRSQTRRTTCATATAPSRSAPARASSTRRCATASARRRGSTSPAASWASRSSPPRYDLSHPLTHPPTQPLTHSLTHSLPRSLAGHPRRALLRLRALRVGVLRRGRHLDGLLPVLRAGGLLHDGDALLRLLDARGGLPRRERRGRAAGVLLDGVLPRHRRRALLPRGALSLSLSLASAPPARRRSARGTDPPARRRRDGQDFGLRPSGNSPGCYDYVMHECKCELYEDECTDENVGSGVTWTDSCRCPAREVRLDDN